MNVHQKTMNDSFTVRTTVSHYMPQAGLALSATAAAVAVLSGLGTRWGLWHFMTGFEILGSGAVLGGIAAVVSLVGGVLARHEHHPTAYLIAAGGIVIGLVTAGIPLEWIQAASRTPMIHDISTDLTNPPQFRSILPLRKNADNPAAYGGPAVAMQQQAAYPDIGPLVLPTAKETAFDRALAAAQSMGWRIVGSSEQEGRIEASATTFWFGFTDDVVVRVTPVQEGSRVDVRSVSREGLGDLGTNAKRIRRFLQAVEATGNDNGYTAGY